MEQTKEQKNHATALKLLDEREEIAKTSIVSCVENDWNYILGDYKEELLAIKYIKKMLLEVKFVVPEDESNSLDEQDS